MRAKILKDYVVITTHKRHGYFDNLLPLNGREPKKEDYFSG